MEELKKVFKVVKHAKSDVVVYIKIDVTVGIGTKQMCRIISVRIVVQNAKEITEFGAKAVIQLGGSMRDSEINNTADEVGLVMVFTVCSIIVTEFLAN